MSSPVNAIPQIFLNDNLSEGIRPPKKSKPDVYFTLGNLVTDTLEPKQRAFLEQSLLARDLTVEQMRHIQTNSTAKRNLLSEFLAADEGEEQELLRLNNSLHRRFVNAAANANAQFRDERADSTNSNDGFIPLSAHNSPAAYSEISHRSAQSQGSASSLGSSVSDVDPVDDCSINDDLLLD